MGRDYYCRQKFRALAIDPEKKTTYNCYTAQSQPIDVVWLKQNPGQLFNTDVNVSEREMMLNNTRNSSCEQSCWIPEDQGLLSTRMIDAGHARTHVDPHGSVETLNFITSSTCNLTCSYCCKEFSTAWSNDCEKNGEYQDLGQNAERYRYSKIDQILKKVSQAEKFNMSQYQLLLDEVALCADKLISFGISGGEPLLHNRFLDILQLMQRVPQIKIYTGLGVNIKRFETLLDKIKDYKNVVVSVSMENVGALHEFNRYGTKWADMTTKIELLKQSKVNTIFSSTLSNLSIFGFAEFYNQFESYQIRSDVVNSPSFMPLYVIDDASKQRIADDLASTTCDSRDEIIKSLSTVPSTEQRVQLQSFLRQFIDRRPDLNIDVFPKSFQTWVTENVV